MRSEREQKAIGAMHYPGGDPVDRQYRRAPNGTIANCAAANGAPEKDCQMCGGACPDRLSAKEEELISETDKRLPPAEKAALDAAYDRGWRPAVDVAGIAGSRDPAIPSPLAEGDEVEVSWGEATYAPVKFNSFTVGPFSARTKVRPGESGDDARGRLLAHLRRVSDESFREQLGVFLQRVEESAREADKAAERSRAR